MGIESELEKALEDISEVVAEEKLKESGRKKFEGAIDMLVRLKGDVGKAPRDRLALAIPFFRLILAVRQKDGRGVAAHKQILEDIFWVCGSRQEKVMGHVNTMVVILAKDRVGSKDFKEFDEASTGLNEIAKHKIPECKKDQLLLIMQLGHMLFDLKQNQPELHMNFRTLCVRHLLR